MKAKSIEREKSIALRLEGYSLSEISKKLNIALSSVSIWTRPVSLNKKAKSRIFRIKRMAIDKAKTINHKKAILRNKNCLKWVNNNLKNKKLTVFDYQIICSMLYWGEGAKFSNRVEFTNSDPKMVVMFLKSLEYGFGADRKNIKVNLHLHQYHNEIKQKEFWGNLLKISEEQFNKTFWKKNSFKVKRQGYLGCIRICYNSKEIVDKIKLFYRQLLSLIGP